MSSDDPSQPGSSASFPEIDTRRSFLNSLVGLRIADRYKVLRILGEGGMGVVVEARHLELEQNVAIKFMFPEFLGNEVLNARFSREAKLAARVQSPHIVRVSDVGRLPSGVPYLVMDMLSGHDLAAELDQSLTLSVERAVDYTLQACAGIAALHALGVVHRDLKPSNLFVADVSGVSTLKVLDFGISKDVTAPSASITSTDTQLGTPMYMSPEQIRASKNVDARSDIWSLGVILYELLTGTLPFERSGHSVGELFAVILMTEPMPLRMRRPDLSEELEDVVMRCLRRNSWDRFENVGALAEALRPFARASSLHRIDAVRRALGEAGPSSSFVDGQGSLAEHPTVNAPLGSPSQRPGIEASLRLPPVQEPVAASTPAPSLASHAPSTLERALDEGGADLQLEVDYPPAKPAQAEPPRPRLRARASEPQTSPSLITSSRASEVSAADGVASVRAGLVWGLGIAAAIVGAAATFAIRATSAVSQAPAAAAPAAGEAVLAAPAVATTDPTEAFPPPPPPPPAPPAPPTSDTLPVPAAPVVRPPATATGPGGAPRATSAASARPATARAATPGAANAAASRPPPTDDSLYLDRK